MSIHNACAEWAKAQRTGWVGSKAALLMLAFAVDMGEGGLTHAQVSDRTDMSAVDTSRALARLDDLDLIEQVGVTETHEQVYAPKGWQ